MLRRTDTRYCGLIGSVSKRRRFEKRFRQQGSTIALEAANPAYETRMFRDDQVKVQGRLVGLIRTY